MVTEIEKVYEKVQNIIIYESIDNHLLNTITDLYMMQLSDVKVICDNTNNPPSVRDLNEAHVTITYDHGYAGEGTYKHVDLVHG